MAPSSYPAAWPSCRRPSPPTIRARPSGPGPASAGLQPRPDRCSADYLITAASWRWIFFINIPVATAALARHDLAMCPSRETRPPPATSTTPAPSQPCSVSVALRRLDRRPELWLVIPHRRRSVVATVLVASVAFVTVERRARRADDAARDVRQPPIQRDQRASPSSSMPPLADALFLLPVELQMSSGYSPLESGRGAHARHRSSCWCCPPAPGGWRPASDHGCRCRVGPLVLAISLLSLTRATDGRNYLVDRPARMVMPSASALAIMVAPLTATAMASAGSSTPDRLGRQQRRRSHRRSHRRRRPAGDRRHHGHELPAPDRAVRRLSDGHVRLGSACGLGGVIAALTVRTPCTPATPAPNVTTAPSTGHRC